MNAVNPVKDDLVTKELIKLEHKRYDLLKARNIAGMGEMLADEFFYNHALGGHFKKGYFLETLKADSVVVKDVKLPDPEVVSYGDIALVTGTSEVRITLTSIDGKPVKENEREQIRYYRWMHVWVRKSDGWKIAARQGTYRQEPTIV